MSATQPTAMTASAASALSIAPSFEKIMRTPRGVLSNDSIAPKPSRTSMPASRKAAATAADTSSSSVGRMRGPAWKSWTREPNALKIDATCTPVAPPPMTSIDGGTAVEAPRIAVGGGQLEAGNRQPAARATRAEDDLVGLEPQPALGLDGVRIDEARRAGAFVDRHTETIHVLARSECARTSSTTSRTRASSRDSRGSVRPRRCRSDRAGGRRGSAGRRGRESARVPVRRWPPCRRTRRG